MTDVTVDHDAELEHLARTDPGATVAVLRVLAEAPEVRASIRMQARRLLREMMAVEMDDDG